MSLEHLFAGIAHAQQRQASMKGFLPNHYTPSIIVHVNLLLEISMNFMRRICSFLKALINLLLKVWGRREENPFIANFTHDTMVRRVNHHDDEFLNFIMLT